MRKAILGTALLGLLAGPMAAHAVIISYTNDQAGYSAATGGDDLFLDFEGVVFGDADSNGIGDVEGNVFSSEITYSSPSNGAFPSRVNIANIGQGIDNEIGPMGTWDDKLRWAYNELYTATGFTGISVESNTTISFFNGLNLVGQTTVGGNSSTFQFFGFVSDVAFDSVELNGIFFAIDAHRSTAVPEPGTIALLGLGLIGLGLMRRRRVA